MSSPTTPAPLAQRIAAGVLAVLLPAIVLAVGLSQLLASPDEALSEAAQRMEDQLGQEAPEVVVVGNSLVGRGIDPAIMGAGLGDSKVRVSRVYEPGTRPANWYLFLANRLYANGHQPHAVVVLMAPQTLFDPELSSELAQKSFANHAGETEPVVNLKVFGREAPNPWLQRLRDQRGRFQDWWAVSLRNSSVGLFHGDPEQPLLARGEAVAAPALHAVFEADGAVDMALHQRVIPVVEHADEAVVEADGSVVDASFVPDLLDLAEQHGSKVVFVWAPMLPETEAKVAVDPLVQAELVRLLNERGAAYVDMSGLGYPRQLFEDYAHLGPAGKKRFSAELAAALKDLGIMQPGPFAANRVPQALDYQVELVGEPPDLGPVELGADPDGEACRFLVKAAEWQALSLSSLAAARVGNVSPLMVFEDGEPLAMESWPGKLKGACHGAFVPQSGRIFVSPGAHEDPPRDGRSYRLGATADLPVRNGKSEGWFVYPGTSLRFDVQGLADAAGAVAVDVGLEPLVGPAAGAVVRVQDQAVELASSGRFLQASASVGAPGQPWSVVIDSPADGPWLLVRHIAVRAGDDDVDLIGRAELMQPPAVDFLTNAKQSEATTEGEHPGFPFELEPFGKKGAAQGTVEGIEELHAEAIAARVACGSCSPLRLAEDGVARGKPARFCGAVAKAEPGAWCIKDGAFLFTADDGAPVLESRRDFRLALQPERVIKLYRWVYPGDLTRVPLPNLRRRELRDGASWLRLEGIAMAGERQEGELTLRLLVGGEPAYQESLPVRAFDEGPVERDLGGLVELRGKTVTLELSSEPDAPFLLLTAAVIGE